MNEVPYIVLGAILALLGGMVTQIYQNWIVKGKDDRESLLSALDVLIDMGPVLNGLPAARSDVEVFCKELFSKARRIQTKKYQLLAEKLIEFALKDARHTREDWNKLMDEIVEEISKPYHGYHEKEKEFFKQVAREMVEASRQGGDRT